VRHGLLAGLLAPGLAFRGSIPGQPPEEPAAVATASAGGVGATARAHRGRIDGAALGAGERVGARAHLLRGRGGVGHRKFLWKGSFGCVSMYHNDPFEAP